MTVPISLQGAIEAALQKSFTAELPDDVVLQLRHETVVHHYPPRRIFIEEGAEQRAGILVNGLARVFRANATGVEVPMRMVHTGAAVGLSALVGEPSPVSVQAISQCVLWELNLELLLELGERHGQVGMSIAREVNHRLHDAYDEIEILKTGSVEQRLTRQLLDEGSERGENQPWVVKRTHGDLARAIGSSREMVTRVLSRMSRQGLISVDRREIIILSPELLYNAHFR